MSYFPFGVTAPVSLGLLFTAGLAWVATRGNRELREIDDLLGGMVPGQLEALTPFMDARGGSLVGQDLRFWKGTLEIAGMKQRDANAGEIVHLVQHWCKTRRVPDKQLEYVLSRATIIAACKRFYWVEDLLRRWYKEFPHVLARTSGAVYFEMAQRVTTLCEEYAPELTEQLAAVL